MPSDYVFTLQYLRCQYCSINLYRQHRGFWWFDVGFGHTCNLLVFIPTPPMIIFETEIYSHLAGRIVEMNVGITISCAVLSLHSFVGCENQPSLVVSALSGIWCMAHRGFRTRIFLYTSEILSDPDPAFEVQDINNIGNGWFPVNFLSSIPKHSVFHSLRVDRHRRPEYKHTGTFELI